MAYNIATLRQLVRYEARNAKDPGIYSNTEIDYRLQSAARAWLRATHQTKTLDTITLVPGATSLPALPTNFLPEFLISADLTLSGKLIEPGVSFTTREEVLKKQLCGSPCNPTTPPTAPPTGRPYYIGFSDTANAITDTTIDLAYSLNLWWWKPFTSWAAGGTPSPDSFDLPDDALDKIALGASAYLQLNEPENSASAKDRLALFQQAAKEFRGRDAGGRGIQVLHRKPPDWARGC